MSSHYISIWKRSSNRLRQNETRLEYLCLIGLSVAALTLFLANLGSLPLIDPDEGILAQVAKEIYQGTGTYNWIFPQLWNQPYLDLPPLIHNLVAMSYHIAGINEWTTRFPGAFLGAISVLLLYQIGREIFIARLPAMFSALVYLTCLPVVRYSRLATLNGPLLCFELLMIWAVLRSRRDLRWSLVVGISFSLIGLTRGISAVQVLLIVLLFLFWDTPRLLTSLYFWRGLVLGAIPSMVWYSAQWFQYPQLFASKNFLNLFLAQANSMGIEDFRPGAYLLQRLQYVLPWLVVMFAGVQLIKQNFPWGWSKLLAVWLGGYFVLGFLILRQDYWLVLPLYPALALAAGKQLDRVHNLPSYVAYPKIWIYSFGGMALLAILAACNWGIRNYVDFYLPFICGSLAITFGATALVIAQQDKQFIPLLFWGLFVSIFLLVVSPHWIWEGSISSEIKPVAKIIKEHTPQKTVIYSSLAEDRPSLNFYSDRQIIAQSIEELKQSWQQKHSVYLLLDSETLSLLKLPQHAVVEDPRLKSLGWVLVIKNRESVLTKSALTF